jgi:hypothetical protein
MTFSKAWLEKKIMCGLCNFGCCNHPSFHVEITEEEQEFYQKEYDLSYIEPIKWHKSEYEQIIDREMRRKSKVTKHDFF